MKLMTETSWFEERLLFDYPKKLAAGMAFCALGAFAMLACSGDFSAGLWGWIERFGRAITVFQVGLTTFVLAVRSWHGAGKKPIFAWGLATAYVFVDHHLGSYALQHFKVHGSNTQLLAGLLVSIVVYNRLVYIDNKRSCFDGTMSSVRSFINQIGVATEHFQKAVEIARRAAIRARYNMDTTARQRGSRLSRVEVVSLIRALDHASSVGYLMKKVGRKSAPALSDFQLVIDLRDLGRSADCCYQYLRYLLGNDQGAYLYVPKNKWFLIRSECLDTLIDNANALLDWMDPQTTSYALE